MSGFQRYTTHSRVFMGSKCGAEISRDNGDLEVFKSNGYRFMKTYNKGYSIIVILRE